MIIPRTVYIEIENQDHTRKIPTKYDELSKHDKREALKECILLALLDKPSGVYREDIMKSSDPEQKVSFYQWGKVFNELLASGRIYSPELNWSEPKNPKFYLGRWESQIRIVRGEK